MVKCNKCQKEFYSENSITSRGCCDDCFTPVLKTDAKIAPVLPFKANCGHSVPRSAIMMASRGTSCPDCYDRMSD